MASMTQFVRVADPADGPAIVGLLAAVRAELVDERGAAAFFLAESRAVWTEGDLAGMMGSSGARVAVAGIDDVVLGVAVCELRPNRDGSIVCRLDELVVHPEARGVGLGVSLLDDAIEWAQHRGATGIESYALPGQRATKNFFEAAGMKARLLVVHRGFGDPIEPSDAASDE